MSFSFCNKSMVSRLFIPRFLSLSVFTSTYLYAHEKKVVYFSTNGERASVAVLKTSFNII